MVSKNLLASFAVIFGAAFCLPTVTLAQSQANTGTIEGSVTDPSGRSVANAAVTIVNTGTNFTRELQTDTEGRFRGLLLPLGPYKVTVKAPSFGTAVRQGWIWRWGNRFHSPSR